MQSILIYRPDQIGDVVLFSGALKYLRALYPDAKITLAVQRHIVNIFNHNPYVDKVVSVDALVIWRRLQYLKIKGAFRLESLFKKLETFVRKYFYGLDLIIYPVRSPQKLHLELLRDLREVTATDIVGIAGCHLNKPAGGYGPDIDPRKLYSSYIDIESFDPYTHDFEILLLFLDFLGCKSRSTTDILPELFIKKQGGEHLKLKPVLGIFPGASNYIRCWPLSRYAEVAEYFKGNFNYIIFGSSEDMVIANEIEAAILSIDKNLSVSNIAGRTTLAELATAISGCSVLLSTESAGLHIGIALNVNTVCIAGGGHYGRCVPWGDPQKNIFITNTLECYKCNWHCIDNKFRCINDIQAQHVIPAIQKLMDEQ